MARIVFSPLKYFQPVSLTLIGGLIESFMAMEYLAMYIEVQFQMGQTENPIVPVRHFSSSRPRLGEAVQSGNLFTDINDALREFDLILASPKKEISVLFDSSLPGRENIIKGRAKTGMKEINKTMADEVAKRAQIPAIQPRPDVSGFTLFFGMKTVKTPFPRPILDVVHWRNFFTKPGAFAEVSSPNFERVTRPVNGNFFEAMTFRDWNTFAFDRP